MEKTEHGWQIIDANAGILSFTYAFDKRGTANCLAAKLPSGGLLVISPPSNVSTAELGDLETFGKIEAVVANNGWHHLGLGRLRELVPDARFFAAPGAAARIAKKSSTAGKLEPLSNLRPLLGDQIDIVEVPSSRCGETWTWVKSSAGYVWYASDILANMQLPSQFVFRTLFKWTNSAPGYRVFNLALKFIVRDKKAALSAMLQDLRKYPPSVMIPGHGAILVNPTLPADTEALLVAATS